MPRGDHQRGCCNTKGQPCKRIGERRTTRKIGDAPPQPPHRVLAARQQWFDTSKLDELDKKTKYDRASGHVWHRPGSQRKGR